MKTCEVCGTELTDLRNRTCSYKCKGVGSRKQFDNELFMDLVKQGKHMNVIAYAVGIHPITVKRFLRRDGLYRQWASNRYLKCKEVA